MNDSSRTTAGPNTGMTLMGFALGAVVGAGLALLLAPDSGKQTRQRLAATARRWSSNTGRAIDQARDTVADLGASATSAIKAGQNSFMRDRETRAGRRMSPDGEGRKGLHAVNPPSGETLR